MIRKNTFISIALAGFLLIPAAAGAQEPLQTEKLVAPEMEGGLPLMKALRLRKSVRDFSPKELTDQDLSNLLWAAFGINRPESGKRTAPSAVNWQEIDIFVAMKTGLYLYLPVDHSLNLVLAEDIRALTGGQDFVKQAPVNLIYVADYNKITRADESQKMFYSAADTGFISQNVYLFCASEGLGTVVRGLVNREPLAEKMKLSPNRKIVFAQTVGYIPR